MSQLSNTSEKIRNLLVPVIAVLLGFLIGGIVMAAFGYNPIEGYSQMFKTAFLNPQTHQINPRNIGEIFVTAAPLIFTALGFSVANSAGFFNIGLSGQALCGWVASIWLALSLPDVPKGLLVPVVLLVGALAGALAAAVPGVLRALFGTSEVIVTIMMNYIILYGANHIVTHVMSKDLISNTGKTKLVGQNATLQTEFLRNLTQGSRLNIGIFLALIFLVLTWFLMKKTTLGFEIRSVGLNPDASEYAGMSSKRTIIFSMVISGFLAGLGGVIYGLGTFQYYFSQGSSLSIGFDGMAVSLLGSGSSIGILLSALLFSVLKLGGAGMQMINIPSELVDVDIAIIIFFVGISFVIRFVLAKFFGNKRQVAVVEEIETKPSDQDQEGGVL
ncbi:ABC transporter permease [Enterococcus asini]|uniref:ABC transporter permease n=1 Tax=Enterococcus asini TaxID=57732 RepID=A0AAW8TZM5_9ENTE|nr:ABC transporter permease [Enterococcus asini]MCD5028799.1 ABC transporter permease [Enterococcus asini]MDT2743344.1 ABC transporter permease [Enterococcus asini]MDT2764096.1 ABC transporter permease [Enterococcus asini]MDT2783509.1 ABC transporter permease [Enterococcus asini]MDT2810454.1 ABC transporter permease [Enterococcus asini]